MDTCIIKLKNKIKSNFKGSEQDLSLKKFTNQMINKITNNLEGFNYNVIIANIYEIYNFVNKEIEKNIDSKSIKDNYKKILLFLLLQFHSSECLEDLGYQDIIEWPKVDKNLLVDEKVDYIIQINGKKRPILKENRDMDQESLLKIVKSNKLSEKYLKINLLLR